MCLCWNGGKVHIKWVLNCSDCVVHRNNQQKKNSPIYMQKWYHNQINGRQTKKNRKKETFYKKMRKMPKQKLKWKEHTNRLRTQKSRRGEWTNFFLSFAHTYDYRTVDRFSGLLLCIRCGFVRRLSYRNSWDFFFIWLCMEIA